MDAISKLAEQFAHFPGIGARQSKRFVYFLLRQNRAYVEELAKLMKEIHQYVIECGACHRYFIQKNERNGSICTVCVDPTRDPHILLVVEKDSDLESFERSHLYNGQYFVLGGTLQILEKDPDNTIRITALKRRIDDLAKNTITEVILASSITPESEHTLDYVREMLEPLKERHHFRISMLGRGLSTGSELEYSDPDTLRYALEGRK